MSSSSGVLISATAGETDEKKKKFETINAALVPDPDQLGDEERTKSLALLSYAKLFVIQLHELQGFAKAKHEILRDMRSQQLEVNDYGGNNPDGLPANMLSKPKWLDILLQLFARLCPSEKVTSGKFCSFLAFVLTNLVQLSEEESAACNELLDASNDSHAVFGIESELVSPQDRVARFNLPRDYWGRRFFQFVSVLNEMKTVPKDEKSLELPPNLCA